MSIDRHISSTHIIWAVGLFFGLCLALIMGSAVGRFDIMRIAFVLGTGIGIATFLALGKNYWLLIPLSLGANFPAVPLGGRSIEFPELAIAGCSLFFIIRVATRKEKIRLFTAINTPFLLFIAWVGMVFLLNPTGLALIGSDVGGARFYLKVGLAFASFVILSNRAYTEKDIKWVLGLLIFGTFFSMVYGIAQYLLIGPTANPTTGIDIDEFYTWHQLLSHPALAISALIFARWSPREVFGIQKPLILVIYIICIGFVLISGKRMALVGVVLAPMLSAIMFRQIRYIFLTIIMAIGFLMMLLTGQGQWFKLPLVVQRTVSWLPGDWDPELDRLKGGNDEWRAELRRIAILNIKRDPWIGRGFAVDIQDTVSALNMMERGGDMEVQVASYALGHAWHNTWLGYAADFGIPFSIIQAIIMLTVLIVTFRIFKACGNQNLFGVFALFVFIYVCRDFFASWTSGHSALVAYSRWWMYGIVIAIYNQIQSAKKTRYTPKKHLFSSNYAIASQPAEATGH